ncbi:MAG TPA: hypothetical protein VIS48_09805 [Candidatus Kryptonia bacterium]
MDTILKSSATYLLLAAGGAAVLGGILFRAVKALLKSGAGAFLRYE